MKKYSKIATIVYTNYTENVDMLNPLFKQSELDKLVKTDDDIVRIDYYINGVLVGEKMYTPKQAINQMVKLNITAGKIGGQIEYEIGDKWFAKRERNKKRNQQIAVTENKIEFYKQFITEQDFDNSAAMCDFCCTWEEFVDGCQVHN